jgi:hypothetical protein
MQKKNLILLISTILLVSCASPALPPTETPTPRPSLTPTLTSTPSPTNTPEPTPTPTQAVVTLAEWQGMDEQAKLEWIAKHAPETILMEDGTTLYRSQDLAGQVVVYRDETGRLRAGWDVVSGAEVEKYGVYEAMLEAAGLNKKNAWGNTAPKDTFYRQASIGVLRIDPDVVERVQMGTNVAVGFRAIVPDQVSGTIREVVMVHALENPNGEKVIDWEYLVDLTNMRFGQVYAAGYAEEVFRTKTPVTEPYWYTTALHDGRNPVVAMKLGEDVEWKNPVLLMMPWIEEGFPLRFGS